MKDDQREVRNKNERREEIIMKRSFPRTPTNQRGIKKKWEMKTEKGQDHQFSVRSACQLRPPLFAWSGRPPDPPAGGGAAIRTDIHTLRDDALVTRLRLPVTRGDASVLFA